MREYFRVTPTSEELEPERIPQALDSLHKLTAREEPGLTEKLNPFHSESPVTFEFLAISDGPDDPVEFFFGADDRIDTLEKRLRSIYPATFDIERVEMDMGSRLVRPVEFTQNEFLEHYERGDLRYEFGPDEQYDPDATIAETAEKTAMGVGSGEDTAPDRVAESVIDTGDTMLQLDPPSELPGEDPLTALAKPTMSEDGTVFARPATDTVDPVGVRWYGSAARKQDWMTSLTQFTADYVPGEVESVDQPGAALAALIDHLMEATDPVAFQVLFQRRASWQTDAAVRTEDLIDGRDTLFQELMGSFLEVRDQRTDQDERQLSDAVSKRIEYIGAKNPKRSFTANIRAVGVPTDDGAARLGAHMDSLIPAFDPLDGPFYEVNGKRLRENGFRASKKAKNARAALDRLLNRDLKTGSGRTRPDLILSGAELANFVLVPSSEQLTVEGTRGTRAEQQSRNPLPWPNPDLVQQFQEGMAVGYALDENGVSQPDPIRIPPALLTTHYGRFASTGGGKSKAIINDALSLRATTGGPVVIVDPKGDGMCGNYLRCHYERFDGLDDVYQFRVPETIPAFSFFDIRPALDAGRNREDAIQDTVDHFHDILRMVMGREQHGQAFVANEILSYLIKALFDEEYGSDVFGLDDLFDAAFQMQREETTPPVSADNRTIEESLTRHFAKDNHQLQVSMDAVGNRLDKLNEDAHLRRIFSHVPEGNEDGKYGNNRFDFRDVLDADVTILFDLGDLRPEAQRAITLLLLSNLWDAVQGRRRDGQTDYEKLTNLIIEEAAAVASTKLVSEQLLPQGRSFGLSMGLVMQFPEQVRNRNERAYDEVLNNIKTKLIGNISIERDLAESLAHEDLSPTDLRNRINTLPSGEWIAHLPSPSFGETGPAPFSLKPLPIAPGHPESDQPLTGPQEEHFVSVSRPRMVERTQAQYGLAETSESSTAPEEPGWGSSGADTAVTADDGDSDSALTQSAFIEHPTTEMASTSTNQSDGENATEESQQENSSLFGVSNEVEETPADNQAAQPEHGSIPVQESAVAVPDADRRKRDLSRDDVRFLHRVLEVMNRDGAEYTLLDSMCLLRDEFEELNLQRLMDQNLVEDATACGRKYYTVLPAGRKLLGETKQVGPGLGDLGEKTPHKVGVRLLELWLQQQEGVARVSPYFEYDDETVFDVAGFNGSGDLVWAGEAELPSNNTQAPVNDYDKLCSVDADAIWAFNNRETAIEVLDRLAAADRIEERVTGRDKGSWSRIRDAIADLDAGGMTTVQSFTNLDQEVNQ